MKNFKGFTLAEVLVVLGIIGVVSAMTIPSVINKYKEQVTVNKVKKFYSMISQAYMLSVKDNGYANEWNVTDGMTNISANQIAAYFKPYLKVIKDCGTNSGCLGYTEIVNLLNGNKSVYNYDTDNRFYKMILSDGNYIIIRSSKNAYCKTIEDGYSDSCGSIYVDVNGGKQPNTIGKDMFYFVITPFAIKSFKDFSECSKTRSGWPCGGYILKNGNMDYLH